MKFNQIIIYLIVFIVLYFVVDHVNKTKDPGYKIVSGKTEFSKITEVAADNILIKKDKGSVELKKENGNWAVINKFSYKADKKIINSFIETVKDLKMNDIVSKNPSKRHLFDLDTKGVELIIKNKDNNSLVEMTIGKPGPDWSSNYFCVKGNDHVYLSSKWLNRTIKTDAKEFLEKKLFDIKKDDIEKLKIIYETKEVELFKVESGWKLNKPEEISAKKEEVDKLCSALIAMTIFDVASKTEKTEFGFSKSNIKISFSTSDSKEYSFEIGGKDKSNNHYIKTNQNEYICIIAKHNFSNLDPKIEKLREVIEAKSVVDPKLEKIKTGKNPQAEIVTDKGTMILELFEDDAKNTVANFVSLIEKKYYDGLKFHRVIAGFMAQAGCPNSKEGAKGSPGTGGPGYTIKCEINSNKHLRGSLSMAHAGKDTGGSQFFICFKSQKHLDGKHTVFGKILKGLDVLDKITKDTEMRSVKMIQKRDNKYIPLTSKK
jgi:peptidyl-prolyl cis-trans isomerase B (cyclophilin B)